MVVAVVLVVAEVLAGCGEHAGGDVVRGAGGDVGGCAGSGGIVVFQWCCVREGLAGSPGFTTSFAPSAGKFRHVRQTYMWLWYRHVYRLARLQITFTSRRPT